jgi:hypothetical protein
MKSIASGGQGRSQSCCTWKADGIDADLSELEKLYRSGLRSLGLVWSRPNIFGHLLCLSRSANLQRQPGFTSTMPATAEAQMSAPANASKKPKKDERQRSLF